MKSSTTPLTNDQLMKLAPSIFAATAWGEVSERYAFIPTINVVDAIRKAGFFPVLAQQNLCRIDGKENFTKHMVRFQREQDMVDRQKVNPGHFFYDQHGQPVPEVLEIVLTNSHDRSSGYQLDAGLFRVLCSNGLMVKSSNFGSINVRHSGNVKDMVIDGCCKIVDELPQVLANVDSMKRITLDKGEQSLFAKSAMQLRYPDAKDGTSTAPYQPEALLKVRRDGDKAPDLWTTLNVVQENIMVGGIAGRGTTKKRMSTRAIKSVTEDLRVNKALWMLAEGMATYKQ